jgi:DNA-binding MarR family transcriptional regulator
MFGTQSSPAIHAEPSGFAPTRIVVTTATRAGSILATSGPWTPTGLAARLGMPLSTVAFRVKRIERRGHAERVPNPDDGRSFLIRLTPKGKRLLDRARPAFRDYAEAVEARLGQKRVTALSTALVELREAIDDELAGREESAPFDRRVV